MNQPTNFLKFKTRYNDCFKYQIYFTCVQRYCRICYKPKMIIETNCKHRFCIDCFKCLTRTNLVCCYICKNQIDKI